VRFKNTSFYAKKEVAMTEIRDELLCGDDVNLIYGDNWYFEMAEIYLSHNETLDETSHLLYLDIKNLKDTA
jgi:hypothetical protein